jgi:hypothetical protein
MTRFITKLTSTLCMPLGLLVLSTFATTASADTYDHIDELACSIERNSDRLLSEVRRYRHTPEYAHLVSDARDMERLADHIHDLARRHGSLHHLQSDVADLGCKLRHMEATFDRVERNASRGYGHVHGDRCQVRHLLGLIERDLHYLQSDLRELAAPVVVRRPVVGGPVYNRPVVNTRPTWSGYGHHTPSFGVPVHGTNRWSGYNVGTGSSGFGRPYSSGRTISIGGGSSRLTFRF